MSPQFFPIDYDPFDPKASSHPGGIKAQDPGEGLIPLAGGLPLMGAVEADTAYQGVNALKGGIDFAQPVNYDPWEKSQ